MVSAPSGRRGKQAANRNSFRRQFNPQQTLAI
jgi:hypothetical protein